MKHTWCRKISNTGKLRITPNSFGNRCRGWRPMPNTKHTFHKCSQMNGSVSKKEKLASGIVCLWETPKGSKLSARSSAAVYCIKKQKNWIQTCIECLNNCLQINVFPIPRKEPEPLSLMYISSVQSLNHDRLFANQWCAARQASLPITNSWRLLKLMSIASVMPSNHLILCHPLLLPPSIFPSIKVFSSESVLHIRWPSIRVSASASVLPMNIQDWFTLELISLISLQSKGLSRVSPNAAVQKRQFFGTQLSFVFFFFIYFY